MAVEAASISTAPPFGKAVVDAGRSISTTETLMGGRATITVVGGSPDLLGAAFTLARRCESLWSRFIPTSDIMRLNRSEGQPIEVDELTVSLVEAMIEGHTITAGTFDPTLLPDVIAAGYDRSVLDPRQRTVLPASAVAPGRLGDVRIDPPDIQLPRGTTLDAGGIGKGAAADAVCDLVMAGGAAGVMVEIGGDIVVAGEGPGGEAWRLGIENPFAGTDPSVDIHVDVVQLTAGALVTSSVRKRVFSVAGTECHHLIDPSTHRSATTEVQTVSVIASTGARAEVLTKAGFVLDPDEYLDWLPTLGAAGFVVLADGSCGESTNWGDHR